MIPFQFSVVCLFTVAAPGPDPIRIRYLAGFTSISAQPWAEILISSRD